MERQKKLGVILGLCALFFLLVACSAGESSTYHMKAMVTRVIDGDTLEIEVNGKKEKVRLLLIDTPETKKPNTPVQPFGLEASSFTKGMVEGKTVDIEKDVGGDARDKYGRLLYYIYVDGQSLQEELLRQGLARVAYIYPPNVKHVDRYKEIQAAAQKEGVGIWSIENYAQEDGFHPDEEKNPKSKEPDPSPTPLSHTGQPLIKGNINSKGEKIYHVPGGRYYDQTKPEEMFHTEEEAKAAGFRPSKQ